MRALVRISYPERALVVIDHEFAELVAGSTSTERAKLIRGSVGLNFGSGLPRDVATWPVDKSIPEAMPPWPSLLLTL